MAHTLHSKKIVQILRTQALEAESFNKQAQVPQCSLQTQH